MEHSRFTRCKSARRRRTTILVALIAVALLAPALPSSAQNRAPRQPATVVVVPPPNAPPPPLVYPQPVGAIAPRPERPRYEPGSVVQVEWNGQWFDARVLAIDPDGSFRIRYDGWSEQWDESVPTTRIRDRGDGNGRGRHVRATPPPPPPTRPQPDVIVVIPPQLTRVVVPQPIPVANPQPQPSGPNMLANGGFESIPVQPGSFQTFDGIPGWQTTFGRGIEVQAGVAGSPFEGRQFVELDGSAPVGIAQDVSTRGGTVYEVQIAFSARPGTPIQDNRLGVYWDGRLLGRLVADGNGHDNTAWTVATFYVVANGNRSRLELRDEGNPNSFGTYVDDVRVSPAR